MENDDHLPRQARDKKTQNFKLKKRLRFFSLQGAWTTPSLLPSSIWTVVA
jgi:hypothetical protein